MKRKNGNINGDFYCLDCFHFFRAVKKLKFHEKLCKNKGFCLILMLFKKYSILQFNQYIKSDKMLYDTYEDLELQMEKNQEKLTM